MGREGGRGREGGVVKGRREGERGRGGKGKEGGERGRGGKGKEGGERGRGGKGKLLFFNFQLFYKLKYWNKNAEIILFQISTSRYTSSRSKRSLDGSIVYLELVHPDEDDSQRVMRHRIDAPWRAVRATLTEDVADARTGQDLQLSPALPHLK